MEYYRAEEFNTKMEGYLVMAGFFNSGGNNQLCPYLGIMGEKIDFEKLREAW